MIAEQIREWLEAGGAAQSARSIEDYFVIASDVGLKRTENQDRVAVLRVGSVARTTSSWCVCVCDGMGGLQDGGRAASVALSAFFEALIRDRKLGIEERLSVASSHASQAVLKEVKGGGATLSAILIEGENAFSVNLGDSRIYAHDTRVNGRLIRLTTDDTMEDAYGSQGKGLLQYVGSNGKLVPHIEKVETKDDLMAIITSDGAHAVGDEMLEKLCRSAANPVELCSRTLFLSRWIGGVDNATMATLDLARVVKDGAGATASDVSVWTTSGRLKIAWVDNATQRPTEILTGDTEMNLAVPRGTNIEKTDVDQGDLIESIDEMEHTSKPKQKSKPKPKPKRRLLKKYRSKDQVELGFSDEDDS